MCKQRPCHVTVEQTPLNSGDFALTMHRSHARQSSTQLRSHPGWVTLPVSGSHDLKAAAATGSMPPAVAGHGRMHESGAASHSQIEPLLRLKPLQRRQLPRGAAAALPWSRLGNEMGPQACGHVDSVG